MAKIKRNDIVAPKYSHGAVFYGRVWKRIDDDHVVVIDTGKHVTIYADSELVKLNYKGRKEFHYPHRFSHMTSLRRLKAMRKDYGAEFGGTRYCGYRWTKDDRREALANIPRWEPRKDSVDHTEHYRTEGVLFE